MARNFKIIQEVIKNMEVILIPIKYSLYVVGSVLVIISIANKIRGGRK